MSAGRSVPFTLGYGPVLDTMLGLRALQKQYETLPPGDFVDHALRRLDIAVMAEGLDRLPREGAAIVVVNHPTGAMDGLLLLSVLRRVRTDVRVLGNEWLTRIPEMRDATIALNVFTALPSLRVAALRQAHRWLAEGGLLVVFPAGEVARRVRDGVPVDGPWHEGVLALSRWTSAPVVPAGIEARASRWFLMASRIHRSLGTLLLPRELLRQRGARVPVRVGTPVTAARLDALPDAASRLAYLRTRVEALAARRPARPVGVPLAPQVLKTALAREIESLPASARLVESGPLRVYCAQATSIPLALREIGRLREQAFRAAGEGTGRALDLDRFDESYTHLFLWHHTRAEIVGAYRMGETTTPSELYSETLFTWPRRPQAILGDALELGRSFVRPEYQRDPAALLLLWRGIGSYASRHPRLRRLFGPVSVSADYAPATRAVIAAWTARHAAAPSGVRGRHGLALAADAMAIIEAGAAPTLPALEQLVRELEDGRGLPVLLRQYLRLNGRVLAVSRDPDFADAMDALLVVDLLDLPAAHLERYCGHDGAARIRRYWAAEVPEAPCALSPAS